MSTAAAGSNHATLTRLISTLVKAGDVDAATDMLDTAAARRPDDAALLSLRADILFKRRDYPAASAIWSRLAASASPGAAAKLYLKLSRAAEASGDAQTAAGFCRRYLATDPDNEAVQNRLLGLELQTGTPEERAARAQAHFAAYGRSAQADLLVAIGHGLDTDSAATHRMLVANPEAYDRDPALGLRVIDALLARGLVDGVLPVIDSLARAAPDDLRFAERRVQAVRASGAPRGALIAARRRLAEHPRADDRHRLRYARACLQASPAETLDITEAMLARRSDDLEAAALAIRAAYRLERGSVAADHLARALSRAGDGPQGSLAAARLYGAAGRWDDVLATLDGQDGAEAVALRFDAAWQVGDYALGLRLAEMLPDDDAIKSQAAQMRHARALVSGNGPIFPDALFEQALAMRRPPSPRTGEAVVIVTSNLGAGGAERQVALTAANVARLRAAVPGARTVLLARSLDPAARHDVMLPIAQNEHLEIDDLSVLSPGAAMAELERLGEPRKHLDVVAAFPQHLAHEIANLYLRFVQLAPRVVHLWQDGRIAVGSVAAALAGVPRVVASIRNVLPEENDRRRFRRFLPIMYRVLGKRDDVVFSTNSRVAARDYAILVGRDVEQFAVIRNGVELASIRSRVSDETVARVRDELGIGDARLLGGVFRLAPAKRPAMWLRTAALVAAALPEARFVIVGDGVLRAEMKTLAASLGLGDRMIFAGQRSPVEPWIAAMDLFLLTSSVEGLPNVLLEAQALGVPVVTTDAGGAREALMNKVTGRLVMDETPEALSAAALALLRQPNTKAKSGISGPRFIASHFGVDRMVAATMRAYGMA